MVCITPARCYSGYPTSQSRTGSNNANGALRAAGPGLPILLGLNRGRTLGFRLRSAGALDHEYLVGAALKLVADPHASSRAAKSSLSRPAAACSTILARMT